MQKQVHSIRELSELNGKLVAACPDIDYGWLYLRPLERFKNICLEENNFDYESVVIIPDYLLPDLLWWEEKVRLGSSRIRRVDFSKVIFMDASNSGCGATDRQSSIHGFWDENHARWHINFK